MFRSCHFVPKPVNFCQVLICQVDVQSSWCQTWHINKIWHQWNLDSEYSLDSAALSNFSQRNSVDSLERDGVKCILKVWEQGVFSLPSTKTENTEHIETTKLKGNHAIKLKVVSCFLSDGDEQVLLDISGMWVWQKLTTEHTNITQYAWFQKQKKIWQ